MGTLLTIAFVVALGVVASMLNDDKVRQDALDDFYRAEYRHSYPVGF